jgi:hypothetical protein
MEIRQMSTSSIHTERDTFSRISARRCPLGPSAELAVWPKFTARLEAVLLIICCVLVTAGSHDVCAQSTGNLNVTVKNQSGTNISGATVVRYTSSWGYIDQKTTNSSGVASWPGIPAATYNLEAYYGGEYWVWGSATVTAGNTTNKTLQRNEPYAYDFRVYNGSTDVTGQNVIVGTPLTYKVSVRNSSGDTRSVRVYLCVDRTAVSGSDFCETSTAQNISSGGGTYTFTFNHTPTQTGTYSRQIEVQTSVNSNWVKTDFWPWGTAFTGIANAGDLDVTVKNQSGTNVSGATVVRYTSSWGYIDQKTTNSSGVASWTGLSPATYNLEAYYSGEFWVWGSATVTAGNTTNKTLQRNEPYAYDFRVYNGSTDVTNQNVIVGTPLTYKVSVRNSSGDTRSVRVYLCVDRTGVSGSDFCQTSAAQNISSGGGTYTFTFSHTPTQTGTYSRQIEVQTSVNSNWVKTDFWPWGTAFTGIANAGDLDVTVKNQSGTNVSGATVVRYTSSWGYIDQKTTNSSGVASWTGLSPATYNLEAYYSGEFWVWGSATVTAGNTTNKTLQRNEPYAYDFRVYNGSTDVTNQNVIVGTPLTYKVSVRNSSGDTRSVRVYLCVDRTGVSGSDFCQTSAAQNISSGGGTYTFTFSHTPTQTGTYSRQIEVQTSVNSNWVKTDFWPWGTAFEGACNEDAEIVGFAVPTGAVLRGQATNVTVSIKNAGTCTRSFWVGLSFWGPMSESWPNGWLDVIPKQTGVMSPEEQKTLVFNLTIPGWLPEGQYGAITRVWSGYDPVNNLMVFPDYDQREEPISFYLSGPPEVDDLAGESVFPPTDINDLSLPYQFTHQFTIPHRSDPGPYNGVIVKVSKLPPIAGGDARVSILVSKNSFNSGADAIYGVDHSQLLVVLPNSVRLHDAGNGIQTIIDGDVRTWQEYTDVGIRAVFKAIPVGGENLLDYVCARVVKKLFELAVLAVFYRATDAVDVDLPYTIEDVNDNTVLAIEFDAAKWGSDIETFAEFELRFDMSYTGPPVPISIIPDIRYKRLLGLGGLVDADGPISNPSAWMTWQTTIERIDDVPNLECRKQININPNALISIIAVTVQTSPSGRSFSVDGTPYTTPQTFDWTPGSNHTIATTSPQSGGAGTQYVWSNWSDGGAISHTVAPTVPTTYTASFSTQYYLTTQSSPGGGGTVTPSSGWYNSGAGVQVQGTANGGYSFTSWTGSGSGSYTGTNNPASVTMNGPITQTANFVPACISVTVQPSPTGRSFTVDGAPYTTGQTFCWTPGSNHTIATTSPQSGGAGTQYVWSNWSDGGAISHTVAPTVPTTYTASFSTQYYLTTQSSPGGGGTVTPPSNWYNSGTGVQVQATPNGGYTFSSWTGGGTGSYTGTNNPATVTMNGPITQTANFVTCINVTIQTSPAGRSFSVDGTPYTTAQTFCWTPGSSHTIATTSPQSGGAGTQYVWSNWSDGGAISHTVAPTTPTTYTANFTTQYYLTTQASPGAGGTVTPPSNWYNSSTGVQVQATPANGYTFVGWSGTCYSGPNNPQTITINAPCSLIANFMCTALGPVVSLSLFPSLVLVDSLYCITWNAVAGATSYEIRENSGPWSSVGNVLQHCLRKSAAGDYCYNLRAKTECATGPATDSVCVTVDIHSDVREITSEVIPTFFALVQNYPNPFNAATLIQFSVPTFGRVQISIYDILGREVIRLADQDVSMGQWSVTWDATDAHGRPVSSGVYFYRLTSTAFTATKKMVLLK